MVKAEVRKLLESGNKVWGYWRVSTAKQKMERQIHLFEDMGIEDNYIFGDKVTGNSQAGDRKEYRKLKKYLSSGDYLVIKNLDRLERDKKNISKEYWNLVDKGVHILVVDTHLIFHQTASESKQRSRRGYLRTSL